MIYIIKGLTALLIAAGVFSVPICDLKMKQLKALEPVAKAIVQTAQTPTQPDPIIVRFEQDTPSLATIISISALVIGIIALYTKQSIPVTILRVENAPTSHNREQAARFIGLVDEGIDLTLNAATDQAIDLLKNDPIEIAEALVSGQQVIISAKMDINALIDALHKANKEALNPKSET